VNATTGPNAAKREVVRLGYVSGVYGIQGWVKVHSFTDPRSNILDYPEWILLHSNGDAELELEHSACQGKNVLAKLATIDDREQARALIGTEIALRRDDLPPCGPDEFYWADLEGLEVRNEAGEVLGRVDHLIATGANDVLVLEGGEHLLPFVLGDVVRKVDLEAGCIVVDWDTSDWEQ